MTVSRFPSVRCPRRTALVLSGLLMAAGAGAVAVPGVASASPCQTLQTAVTVDRGDTGPAVLAVQCTLRLALRPEAADLAADGVYGPATERAVTSLQALEGLRVDGVVGPATYRALKAAVTAPARPAARPSVAMGPTLRRGDTGAAVRVLQAALGVTVDGHYGPRTEQAVAGFQGRQGLLVDGIAGPRTRTALARDGVDGF